MIVLDASGAVIGLLSGGESRAVLRDEAIVCPHLVDSEVAHALRSQTFRGATGFCRCPAGAQRLAVTRIGSVVVAALTRARPGLVPELTPAEADRVPNASVVEFDNLHNVPRSTFRRRVAELSPSRIAKACRGLQVGTGC